MSKAPYKIRSFQIVNGERLIDTGDGTFLLKPHQDLDSTFSFFGKSSDSVFYKTSAYG